MSDLTNEELDRLLQHAQAVDRRLGNFTPNYEMLAPRIARVLQENRTLRDQAAERQHMQALEGET